MPGGTGPFALPRPFSGRGLVRTADNGLDKRPGVARMMEQGCPQLDVEKESP